MYCFSKVFSKSFFLTEVSPFLASKEAVDSPVQSPSSQSALFGLYDFAPSNSVSKKFLKSDFLFFVLDQN